MKRVVIRAFFMQQYARQAKSITVDVEPAERPFSNFEFIARRFTGCPTLARLMSQARFHGVRTIVVEKLKPSADLREVNEDLAMATGHSVVSQAHRVTFFAKRFKRQSGIEKASEKDIIGYAILTQDQFPGEEGRWRIYESVIKKSCHVHNFIHGEQDWTCSVSDSRFTIPGYLYAEQNGVTNVCAHAALRTATARFTPGGLSYRQMNQLVGIDHKKKKADVGLDSDQIVRILEHSGARCFVGDFTRKRPPPVSFQKYIYNGIESGFPSIIFFGTTASKLTFWR